jgi:hypothetical protein
MCVRHGAFAMHRIIERLLATMQLRIDRRLGGAHSARSALPVIGDAAGHPTHLP